MKEIDTIKMYKEDIIANKESIVKIACTRNLGLLKANAKLKSLVEAERKLKEQGRSVGTLLQARIKIARSELKKATEVRDNFYRSTRRLINESDSMIEQSYSDTVAEFFADYQEYYGDDKKFDECFDGLVVLDKQFLDDYKLFESEKMEPEQSGSFAYLLEGYLNYLGNTKKVYEFCALKELVDALQSDFGYFNEEAKDYGKPKQTVAKVKKSEIEKLIKLTEDNFVQLANEIKEQNNMIASLKNYAKQFPENESISEGIALCTLALGFLQDRAENLHTFQKRVYDLFERLEYSNNVWYSNTKVSRKLKSFFMKPFARKIKPVTDEVYFGSAEAELLKFDSRALTVGDTSIIDLFIQRTGPAPTLQKYLRQLDGGSQQKTDKSASQPNEETTGNVPQK